MDVAVECRAEAVEEGDGAESGLRGSRCVAVGRRGGSRAEESLDLGEEDRGECRDGLGAIGEEARSASDGNAGGMPNGIAVAG